MSQEVSESCEAAGGGADPNDGERTQRRLRVIRRVSCLSSIRSGVGLRRFLGVHGRSPPFGLALLGGKLMGGQLSRTTGRGRCPFGRVWRGWAASPFHLKNSEQPLKPGFPLWPPGWPLLYTHTPAARPDFFIARSSGSQAPSAQSASTWNRLAAMADRFDLLRFLVSSHPLLVPR